MDFDFTNNITGQSNITLYIWNFGDGSPNFLSPNNTFPPTHTYPAPGNYTVTLFLVTNNNCNTQITLDITAPIAGDCMAAPSIDGGLFLATAPDDINQRIDTVTFTNLISSGLEYIFKVWGDCCQSNVWIDMPDATRVNDTTFLWNGMQFVSTAFDPTGGGTMVIPTLGLEVFSAMQPSVTITQIASINSNANPRFNVKGCNTSEFIIDLTGTAPAFPGCANNYTLTLVNGMSGLPLAAIPSSAFICGFFPVFRVCGAGGPCCNNQPIVITVVGGTKVAPDAYEINGLRIISPAFDPTQNTYLSNESGCVDVPITDILEVGDISQPVSITFQLDMCGDISTLTRNYTCTQAANNSYILANSVVGNVLVAPVLTASYTQAALVLDPVSLIALFQWSCCPLDRSWAIEEDGVGAAIFDGIDTYTLPNGTQITSQLFDPTFAVDAANQFISNCNQNTYPITWSSIAGAPFTIVIDLTLCGDPAATIRINVT